MLDSTALKIDLLSWCSSRDIGEPEQGHFLSDPRAVVDQREPIDIRMRPGYSTNQEVDRPPSAQPHWQP